MEKITKELLARFFENKYSREDYYKLKKFAEKTESRLLLKNIMEEHWNEFISVTQPEGKDLSDVLYRMNKIINEEGSIQIFKKAKNIYFRIAAVILLPLLIASGLLYFQFNKYLAQKDVYVEVHSPEGSRTSLNLPDGSKVWLNGGATIKYSAVFNKYRKVEMEGEAYFEVESNLKYPFIVATEKLNITATGTKFNVVSYNDDDIIDVMLNEGKVEISDKEDNLLKKMQHGFQLIFDKNNLNIDYQKIGNRKYIKWTEGMLTFDNSSMEEVVKRLERWYNINIEIKDKELMQLHFKATFIDEGIEEALKLLQQTSTFNYTFEKREKNPDGSYKKNKVVIRKAHDMS